MTFIDDLEPQHALARLRTVTLLATMLALVITIFIEPLGIGAELNPAAVAAVHEFGWTVVGVTAIAVLGGLFAFYRRLVDTYPRVTLAAAGVVALVSVADLTANVWVLYEAGVPTAIWWGKYGPRAAAVIAATALVVAAPHAHQRFPLVTMLRARTPTVEVPVRGRQLAAVVFGVLLTVAIIGPGVIMLPGVDSDHGGTAAAEVESSSFNQSLDVSSEGSVNDAIFNDDGTKMYIADYNNSRVISYTLSNPWDISTASYTGNSYSPGHNLQQMAWGSEGETLYIVDQNEDINEHSLSSAYDLTTASGPTHTESVSVTTGYDITVGDDGYKLYYGINDNGTIKQFSFATRNDLSSISSSTISPSITNGSAVSGIAFNGDGSKLFITDSPDAEVYEHDVPTPYDISSLSYSGNSFSTSGQTEWPVGLSIGKQGEKFYVIENENGEFVFEYDSDISGFTDAVSGDVTGRVLDQNGDPVENATVYSVGYNTSAPPQLDTRNLEEVLDEPLPTEWQDQIDTIPRFEEKPEFDADGVADEWEKPRVLMHTASDWELDTVPHTRDKVETVPADVQPRAITKPGEEQLFACWRFDGLREFGDGIDLSVVGGETTPCNNLTIERVDPLGATQYKETVEPKPLIASRALANIGWSDDTGRAVKHHYGYRTDLGQGVYRVYPEGDQKRAMYYVVAPNNDPSQLEADIQNWAGDTLDRRTKFNDEMEQLYSEGSIDVQSTTTNETGYYGLHLDTSKVTQVELRAVKGGTELATDPQNLSQDHLRSEFEASVKQSFDAETGASFETADDATFRSVCERMDSVLDDVGSPYVGSTTTSVPNDNADIEGVRLIPPDADERVRKCAAMNIAEQIADDPLALLPGFTGDLAGMTKAELESLYDDLMGLVGVNDALRSELEDRFGSDLPDDGSSLSEAELETVIRDGFEVIESPPSDAGYNDGGGSALPGGGSDAPVIEAPEETQDRVNETISRTWPVTGVGDINSSDVGVLIRIVFSDGSEEVLGPDSQWVTLEDNMAAADKVHLEEYPFGTGDAAVAEVSLDVTTPDGHGRNRGRARNPTFDGTIPGLDSVRLSTTAPGDSDTITVGANPEDATRWGGVQHVNVTGPTCSKQVNGTDDAAEVEMCGVGMHRLAVTYTNSDGARFTEVVQVNARAASQARPPAIRAGAGPVGRYAIVANGLEDGRLKVSDGASVVTLTGIVPQESDVPSRVTASTTGVDVARDATTTVRLRQGDTEQVIRERVGVILHVDQVSETSLLYRNGRPIRNPGETADAIVEHRNKSTSIDSYTSEAAEMSVEVSRDPGLIERFTHNVRLRFPSLPIGFAVIPVPAGGLLGGLVLAARRRDETEVQE